MFEQIINTIRFIYSNIYHNDNIYNKIISASCINDIFNRIINSKCFINRDNYQHNASSNVVEVIKRALNFFLFTEKFYTDKKPKKAQKVQNAYKRTKIKKVAFLCA